MAESAAPVVAIVGNVSTSSEAPDAAAAIGRELAKAGFRILVYGSDPSYLETHVVRGYLASRQAARHAIEVRYPLHAQKPTFPEQEHNADAFDWRPDSRSDWEISFYQSLADVDGIVLMGGGNSAMIAGVVALGHGIAVLPIATFGGQATKVWEALRPGRDLVSPDDINVMARPSWDDDHAAECVKALKGQIQRKAEIAARKRLDERRREISVSARSTIAALLFVLSVVCVFVGWAWTLDRLTAVSLLFAGPLLAGVSGATIRLVFDLRQGSAPLTNESALTTAALGLIAGGAAGLLFIIAQVTTAPTAAGEIVSASQASKLVAFGVLIGFTAGLTLDAVFRKLIASDVVDSSVIEARKRA